MSARFPSGPALLPVAWIPSATVWVVVWIALVATSVVLAVLLHTRWRDAKPWKKCALLSAWVHVLLACLATNVRIGVGGPGIGPGQGGPMRVAIVNVAPATTIIEPPRPRAAEPAPDLTVSRDAQGPPEAEREALTPPPPIEALPATARLTPSPLPAEPKPAPQALHIATLAPPSTEPVLPMPDLTFAPPDLLAEPEPEPETETEPETKPNPEPPAPGATVDVEPQPSTTTPAAAATTTLTETNVAPQTAASAGEPPLPNTEGALVDPDATPQSGMPALYATRFTDRAAALARGGGNPTTERAVRNALAWLAAAQERDGHWDPKRHGAGQERYVLGENRGGAGARADTGITALALLAFMGAGHTHMQQGPYAETVARGLDYLRRAQGTNGNLGGDAEIFAHMYCHSMASLAVSEACALTRDEKLRPIVERAVAYSLAAQHPTDGGWRYRSGDTGDTSQLGWQLLALRSAELAGVQTPPATWSRVNHFLKNVERGAAGGLAAYRPEGPPSRAMTAESLFCRQILTHRADGGLAPAALDEARRALLEEPPGGIVVNYYYWYYATIALHRAQHHSLASTEAWDEWNHALATTLVRSQSDDGSWASDCIWGGYGGRVYTTSLAAMCLEVYYRYTPEDDQEALARRDEWQVVPPK